MRNEASGASSAGGGAIYVNSGSVSVARALFDSNKTAGASSSHGGAIYNNAAALTLTDATFTDNAAVSNGGALYTTRGAVTIRATTSATSAGNKAGVGASGTAAALAANGGFLYATGSTAVVNFDITGADTRYVIGDANAENRNLDSIASGGSGAAATGVTLTKTGAGALVLNADNSGYKGAIAISGGFLLLGNSAAKLNASAVALDGGALGGIGTITVGNGGAVEFRASSTLFAGGGLLSLGVSDTGAITLRDGAGFGGSGTISGGRLGALALDSGVIGADIAADETLVIESALAGAGGIEKRGRGTLVLANAANSFSGHLAIAGGTLLVSATEQLGATTNEIRFTGAAAEGATLAFSDALAGVPLANTIAVAPDSAGAFEVPDTRTLTLTGTLAGAVTGMLSKTGAGTLVFRNAHAAGFAGTLRAAEGTLVFSNLHIAGNAIAESGAIFRGSGTIAGDLSAQPNALVRASLPDAGLAASLHIGGTFTANAPVISFDLFAGRDADGILNSDRIFAATFSSSGATVINVHGFAQSGTYNLGSLGALAGAPVTIEGAPQQPGFRVTATTANAGGALHLITTADISRALTWTGAGAADWNISSAGSWTDGGAVTRFANGDRIAFDGAADAAHPASRVITVGGFAGAGVVVSDMFVSGSETYVFRGEKITADSARVVTGPGAIADAAGRLLKTGAGALVFENAANTFRGGIVIESGTVIFTDGAQLGDGGRGIAFNGDATLRLAGAAAHLPAALSIAENKTATIDTQGNELALRGAISGAGALGKTGAGTLVLATAATHAGATIVSAGVLRAGAANVFSPRSRVVVRAGAALDLAGFGQKTGSLENHGAVSLGAGAPRLTIAGDYSGGPGSGLHLTLTASDDAPPQIGSLRIDGVATGQTLVRIQIIDTRARTLTAALSFDGPVIASGTAGQGGAFALADGGRVRIGVYDYVLRADDWEAAREWRLALDDFSPEVSAVAGMDALSLVAGRAAFDSLATRLAGSAETRRGAAARGFDVWADAVYRRDSVNDTLYRGASIATQGVQAGADIARGGDGGAVVFGVFADYARAEMRLPGGLRTDGDARGFGLYGFASLGRAWHFAAILRGSKESFEMAAPNAAALETGGNSFGALLQAGREWETKSGWRVQPLAQFAWRRHRIDDAADSHGDAYAFEGFDSAAARIAADFSREFALQNKTAVTPRVRIGGAYEFAAKSAMTVAGAHVENDLGGLGAELEAGVLWQAGARWSFSFQAAARAGAKFDGYSIGAGAGRRW